MIEEKPGKRYNPGQTSLRHLTKYQLATHYLEVGSHFSIFRVPLTLKQFWNSESTWVGGEGKVDKMSSTNVQSVPRPLTRIEDNIQRKLQSSSVFTWPETTSAFITSMPSTTGRGNPMSPISKQRDSTKLKPKKCCYALFLSTTNITTDLFLL